MADHTLTLDEPPPPGMPDRVALHSFEAGGVRQCQVKADDETWTPDAGHATPRDLHNWLLRNGYRSVAGTLPPVYERGT